MKEQKTYRNPPRLAEWILKKIYARREYSVRLGDFGEIFNEIVNEYNIVIGWLWYWSQTFKSIFIRKIYSYIWSFIMFKNYLKTALRNINKHRGYSFTNISGLSIAIACCILMLLWIHDELSYDRFHENFNGLYRVTSKIPASNEITHIARTANAVGPALVAQYPDVVNFTRYQGFENTMVEANGKSFISDYFAVADPAFFEMFSFSFIKGDPASALSDKNSIVITESFAKKYFGEEEALGQTMSIQISRVPYIVTGVIEDMPETSHIHFDCIVHFNFCVKYKHADPQGWEIDLYYTYLQLREGSNPEDINRKISGIIKEHDEKSLAEIYLQPLKDIHLRSDLSGDLDNYKKGDIKYIYIYCITALSILMIACINFMNLSTARAGRRTKEIGLRKVIGAQKSHLLKQFLGESILLSLFGLFLAVVLVVIALPTFNYLTNKKLVLDFSIDPIIMTGIMGITLFTGVISGLYPAFFLSALKPVNALKNLGFKSGKGGLYLRRTLVILQFVLSIFLIAGTLIVYDQLDYIRNKPLGYDHRNVIIPGAYFNDQAKDELLKNPNFISLTRGTIPSFEIRGNSTYIWDGKEPDREITLYPASADYEYLKTFNMTMKEGRFFSGEFAADEKNFIVNETAAKVMGLENPIGIKVSYKPSFGDEREGVIIGVMKDFHQRSLHNKIEPIIFEFNTFYPQTSIRIHPDNVPEALALLEETWKKHINYTYTYSFLSETIENFYDTDKKTGTIFSYFSLLAIFISCLGLFGLTSFTAEQRKKEIGVRRVLGSSISGITLLLSKEFIKSVTLSLIIACPIIWFVMREWLNSFAYRANIEVSVFVISGILTFTIALFSVSFQVFKAASANPVDSIRND
ncbi:ABC transporter permease [candidate division KSB1 bacterium]